MLSATPPSPSPRLLLPNNHLTHRDPLSLHPPLTRATSASEINSRSPICRLFPRYGSPTNAIKVLSAARSNTPLCSCVAVGKRGSLTYRAGRGGWSLLASIRPATGMMMVWKRLVKPLSRRVRSRYAREELRQIAADASHHVVDRADVDASRNFAGVESGAGEHCIALRFSSQVKNPVQGFTFGRNESRCDICLRLDPHRRISQVHVRIYLSESGDLMLEDTSTNGTVVDQSLLKQKHSSVGAKTTLSNGSKITILMHEPRRDIVFLVQIPTRDGSCQATYERNLRHYLAGRARNAADTSETVMPRPGEQMDIFKPGSSSRLVGTARDANPAAVADRVRLHDGLPSPWGGSNRYRRILEIGQSAPATVYKVTLQSTGKIFAAKELDKRKFKARDFPQTVEDAIQTFQTTKHPNIVKYVEHIDWDDKLLIIITEFVGRGNLQNLIFNGPLTESATKTMAKQLLSALEYLHKMNITHCDVRPDNILIDSFDPFVVKLTNFGMPKTLDEQILRGTFLYCAPELYSEYVEYDDRGRRHPRNRRLHHLHLATGPQHSREADIWSLGGVVFYALTKKPPFPAREGAGASELLHQIMTKPLDISPLLRVDVTEEGINFLRCMLSQRPKFRVTAGSLQKHDWILGISQATTLVEELASISEKGAPSGPEALQPALEPSISIQMVPVEGFPVSLPDFVDYIMASLPLPLWEPPIPPGKIRRCGANLHDDFTELEPGALKDLEAELRAANNGNSQRSHGVIDSLKRSFLVVYNLAMLMINSMRRGSANDDIPLPLRNDPPQTTNPGASEMDILHLLCCIHSGETGTILHQERITNASTDRELFVLLNDIYRKRKSIMSWLSLRHLSKLLLTRFELDFSRFVQVHLHSKACQSASCVCLPTPDRVIGNEYRCRPAPEVEPKHVPVFGDNYLIHYFKSPKCISEMQTTIFNQLPKRACGQLTALHEESALGWGLYFEEGWHWRSIYFITVVLIVTGSLLPGGPTAQLNSSPKPSSQQCYCHSINFPLPINGLLPLSLSEDDFNKNLAKFRTPGRHPDAAVDYAVATWIEPWKATHGLPCRHILYRHLTGDEPVTIQQIHKHWWLWRPQEQQHVGDDDSRNPNVEVVGIMPMPDIPLDPRQVKGKGRPVGAIATTSAASRKKGAGVNSTKRLPSAFEYNIEDELTTAVPAPKQQQQQQQAGAASTKRFGPAPPPPSTAPAALGLGQGRAIEGSSRIEQVQQGLRGRRRDAEWSAQTQTSVEDRIEDCIVVAMTSVKGATANSMVTSTKLGLQRLRQVGRDSYEPGTAAPRASSRFIDGLDALDPDIEDDHDRALAAAEVAAREDQEDAVALGN
ncbi:hypothetical protein CHGG_09511 [Chaetomium globosum CBS 148.51]|uniref:EKC/KEOPS complex subunit BUD32 n=1 Tax=Chaetomium globosum (strain ATCC 6205 / CBS 148.51 / DSM 1962 / NBRC 6347 / NRRL 1970) TaxID=306901 RepID=Q2GR93_CHAGB|nr:uncharacterized protein CHGG_09511 [Chaetomium globosum CBS 148.51]EAQ85497.1 hypothetical protein CHGG_09511 [Chaetomium globosum CBS 148.51]